jgi:hypothetical protein
MVNNITWGSYWSVLIVCTIIYYAYVLLVNYRSDLRKRLAGKPSSLSAGHFQPAPPIIKQQSHSESGEDELFPVVQSLTDEMTAYLEQAGHAVKDEIIFGLQQIFKKYRVILNSAYQDAIEKLLLFECENKNAVHLSDAEIKQVWMG